MADNNAEDYVNNYNTDLGNASKDYNYWVTDQSMKMGRNLHDDVADYDLQGYYQKNGPKDLSAGEHLTDEFKKPNHITFSDQSKYSSSDHQGGSWEKQDDNSYSFTPSEHNLKQTSTQGLIDYFDRYEKGNRLLLPGS